MHLHFQQREDLKHELVLLLPTGNCVPTSVIFEGLTPLTPAFLMEVIEKFKGDKM